MKAYVLLITTLFTIACGDTLDAATQATWWKTKEAMCGNEMREWSKYADRRNRIVDRITRECYAQDNAACTELRIVRAAIERNVRTIDIERKAFWIRAEQTPTEINLLLFRDDGDRRPIWLNFSGRQIRGGAKNGFYLGLR